MIREVTQRAVELRDQSRGDCPSPRRATRRPTSATRRPTTPAPTTRRAPRSTATVDNSCITVPTEARGWWRSAPPVISKRKAYYSNYGPEQTDVAAPGGDFYDTPDNTGESAQPGARRVPEALAKRRTADLNPDGTPNTPFVVRDCTGAVCAYYQYLQGTSMASPHAVGVAALIISRFGHPDRAHRGLTLAPSAVTKLLYEHAPCRTRARSRGCSTTPGSGRRRRRHGGRASAQGPDELQRLLRPRHRQRLRGADGSAPLRLRPSTGPRAGSSRGRPAGLRLAALDQPPLRVVRGREAAGSVGVRCPERPADADVHEPVVQPRGPALPELDLERPHEVAAPVLG